MNEVPKGCKPFNLQEALEGKPVVTRDGRKVKIAGYNPDAVGISLKILGWIDNVHFGWTENARCLYPTSDANKDLFMACETKDVWVSVYEFQGKLLSVIVDSEKEADLVHNSIGPGKRSYGIHKITIQL